MFAFFEILYKPLSFLFPLVIFKDKSTCNDVLEIQLMDGKKVLNSKNANYSFGSLHQVFQYAFKQFLPRLTNVNNVLILGFGAGSVYNILRKDYQYKGNITGVEIDEKVIQWAYKYFNLPENDNKLNIVTDDVEHFIYYTNSKYDLIIVDVYKDLIIPEGVLSPQFFKHLSQNLLNSDGQIIFNVVENHNKADFLLSDENLKIKTKSITINQIKNQIFQIRKTNKV
jgi:predicted TPR repeat methyltransferase